MNIFLLPRLYSCEKDDCYSIERPESDQYIGLAYMIMFLILNIVVIINLVIAILATTYSEFSEFDRGLFYDTMISSLPVS